MATSESTGDNDPAEKAIERRHARRVSWIAVTGQISGAFITALAAVVVGLLALWKPGQADTPDATPTAAIRQSSSPTVTAPPMSAAKDLGAHDLESSASRYESDQKIADRAVLRSSDVGSGFHGKPYTPDGQSELDYTALLKCLGRPPIEERKSGQAFSPLFTRKDGQQILGSVTFVESPEDAMADFKALNSNRAKTCLKKNYLLSLRREGAQNPRVYVSRIRVLPRESNVCAYRSRIVQRVNGRDLTVYVDSVSVIRDRAEVQAHYLGVSRAVARKLEQRTMSAMLGRL
ncbi:hypothetical protein Aph01nite_35770 [Acrocarpospora phusangensis]|uniref:Uncharacterized protein n=1 Tax=Acrocarpospora phusangensis TaxID=1070424 RepID=A0A919QAC5_9ACTN|nr:hypothetical protein [Acrocarpospora phusangensis]GIH25267.1 hypothetical protein Aph01nite_35770 [Acrocarpospora phusangensis]